MTHFTLRAAYAAVLMATMSLAGHAADFNATEAVKENSFNEAGVISWDNIKIENTAGLAVDLTDLSSSQKSFSLKSASGGSINLVGLNGVVSLQNKGTLNIGSNDTANVTISSSENTQVTKLLFAKKPRLLCGCVGKGYRHFW